MSYKTIVEKSHLEEVTFLFSHLENNFFSSIVLDEEKYVESKD